RGGKIPRRYRGTDADRLLQDDDTLVGAVRGDGVAVDALRFFPEPFDKPRRINNLRATFDERFALLGRHEDGEILVVREHELVPFAQDRRPFLPGLAAPRGKR